MQATKTHETSGKVKTAWWRFKTRTLLIAVTIVAMVLGYAAASVHRRNMLARAHEERLAQITDALSTAPAGMFVQGRPWQTQLPTEFKSAEQTDFLSGFTESGSVSSLAIIQARMTLPTRFDSNEYFHKQVDALQLVFDHLRQKLKFDVKDRGQVIAQTFWAHQYEGFTLVITAEIEDGQPAVLLRAYLIEYQHFGIW